MNKNKGDSVKIAILSICIVAVLAVIGVIVFINTPAQRLKRQVKLGDKYLSELNYEDAIMAYGLAVSIDPRNTAGYIGLAEVFLKMEDYESAKAIIERGMKKTRDDEAFDLMYKKAEGELSRSKKEEINNITDSSTEIESLSDPDTPETENTVPEDSMEESSEETEDMDIPEVIKHLQVRGDRVYYNNDQLWILSSNGSIIDKGDYYEIQDTSLEFFDTGNTDPDVDFPMTDEGYPPITIRVRKDASVFVKPLSNNPNQNERMTAEEYFDRNGSLTCSLWEGEGYTLYSAGEVIRFDEKGYLVELGAFEFG